MPALATVLPNTAASRCVALGAQLVPAPLSPASLFHSQLPAVWARSGTRGFSLPQRCRTRMPALTGEIAWGAAGRNSPDPVSFLSDPSSQRQPRSLAALPFSSTAGMP